MVDFDKWNGITDSGQPLVPAEHHCAYFRPGRDRLLNGFTCWYCQWADFRKTADVTLAQSVCRCPDNRVTVVPGSENEDLETEGGGLKYV